MLNLACVTNSDCPFQYHCVQALCEHLPVLPLRAYPTVMYIILPFLIILTNVGGLSGGIYKVVVFMDLLNYTASAATPFMASVNFGGAFANFMLLIFRRHPYRNTSLVDFNVVYIVIPGLLLGTSLGVVLSKLLNSLTQDILLVIVCGYFAYVFIKKYIHKRRVERALSEETVYNIILDDDDDEKSQQRKIFDKYQSGYHARQILIVTVLFCSLLVLTIFSQGSLYKFQLCSKTYVLTTCLLIGVLVLVGVGTYKITKIRQQYFQFIDYTYTIDLSTKKNFAVICAGAVIAGFLQGMLGMGSGHTISLTLLSLGFLPQVVSGTSGFIVTYTTLAALIQQIGMKNISLANASMFFGLVFVISGFGTYLFIRFLKSKYDISNTILLILGGLCVVSIMGIAVNVGLQVHYFGFESLINWRKLC